MARKKREKHQTTIFTFTLETIKLTEEAIKLLNQPLQRADRQNTKVLFAEETMQQVKSKLNTMKQSVGLMSLTGFDYNEKIILIQSLHLYSLILSSLPDNGQNEWKIRQCKRIASYFEAENASAEVEM